MKTVSLAFATLIALPLSATGQQRHITVDDLFELESVGTPVVSPEGDWIAYTVSSTSLEDERSYTD